MAAISTTSTNDYLLPIIADLVPEINKRIVNGQPIPQIQMDDSGKLVLKSTDEPVSAVTLGAVYTAAMKIFALQNELEQSRQMVRGLGAAIETAANEPQHYKKIIEALTVENHEFSGANAYLKTKIDSISKKLLETITKNAELTDSNTTLGDNVSIFSDKTNHLHIELKKQAQYIQNLEAKFNDEKNGLERQLAQQAAQIDALSKQVLDCDSTIDALFSANTALASTVSNRSSANREPLLIELPQTAPVIDNGLLNFSMNPSYVLSRTSLNQVVGNALSAPNQFLLAAPPATDRATHTRAPVLSMHERVAGEEARVVVNEAVGNLFASLTINSESNQSTQPTNEESSDSILPSQATTTTGITTSQNSSSNIGFIGSAVVGALVGAAFLMQKRG